LISVSAFKKTGFEVLGSSVIADYHHRAITTNESLGEKLVAIAH